MQIFRHPFPITFILIILILFSTTLAGEYSSAWQEYLAGHSQDRTVGGIITMSDQVDLRALQDHLYAIHADRQLWHETVVRALQEKATTTQADILSELADLESQGQVSGYRGFWIGNIVIVDATPDVFDLLVMRNDVAQISPDYPIENILPTKMTPDNGNSIAHVENNLRAIGADSCWAMGITGAGRLVSSLDSGVDGTHPALADRWRGVADPRYSDHPEWAWYDPITQTDFPFDSWIHGTCTMGVMCGLSAGTGDTIGVAPDAQWISAGAIGRVDDLDQAADLAIAALQWSADPDGDASTVWDVPDVSNGSWGWLPRWFPDPCEEEFWVALDGCEAAGVVVILSAGNEGPNAETIRNPANRAITATRSFSVGAIDSNDPDFPIANFSSRGPSYCNSDGTEAIKPEVCAPGINIRSCIPGGYFRSDGTSEAAPHVSGVVALMRQANPNLSSEQVYQILMETAVDKGTPDDDNVYGMGVINAYHAVLEAQRIASCPYLPGDINNNAVVNGLDIISAVNYFKGLSEIPTIDCGYPIGPCPEASPFFAAGDVNGNCVFNGIDITYFARFLRIGMPALIFCPDCPPAGINYRRLKVGG